MLFAVAYEREYYDKIMWAYGLRAVFALVGLAAAYCLLRCRPRTPRCQLAQVCCGIVLTMVLGVIPAGVFWGLVEWFAGGYWLWEALQAGAEREIALGTLGLAGWSLVFGDFLYLLFRSSRPEKPSWPPVR